MDDEHQTVIPIPNAIVVTLPHVQQSCANPATPPWQNSRKRTSTSVFFSPAKHTSRPGIEA
jgi:hypothetical protein